MAGVLLCRPVLKFNSMANYDPKITEAMVAWLRGEHSSDESILKGAELLLRVNRNKGLFERIRRYPKGGVKKLEYEIKKHVNYRLQGYTIQDIEALDAEVTPQVQSAVDAAESAADGQLPVVQESEDDGDTGGVIVKGIRPDHDSLPDDIKAIWPANAERWKKIKESYNLLLSLNAPCDRFEHLQLLKETWYKYKSEMCRYDDFRGTIDELVTVVKDKQISEKEQQDIDYAPSYISRNLPILMELVTAAKEPDFAGAEKLESLREKVQNRVNTLLNLHVMLSDQRKADLLQCDIKIDLPSDNAEGEES